MRILEFFYHNLNRSWGNSLLWSPFHRKKTVIQAVGKSPEETFVALKMPIQCCYIQLIVHKNYILLNFCSRNYLDINNSVFTSKRLNLYSNFISVDMINFRLPSAIIVCFSFIMKDIRIGTRTKWSIILISTIKHNI